MNISTLSNGEFRDILIPKVTYDGTVLMQFCWNNVRIVIKDSPAALQGIRLENGKIHNCYFGNAKLNMMNAIFDSCIIEDTTFMYGMLDGTIFKNTVIYNCDIRRANLNNVVFDSCKIVKTDLRDSTFEKSKFIRTELIGQEKWGWCSFDGAEIDEYQKYKYFISNDLSINLQCDICKDGELKVFNNAICRENLGLGKVMYIYSEWCEYISRGKFIEVGKRHGIRI